MSTRFELVGKQRLKLLNVLPMQKKAGQKDLKPAVQLRLRWRTQATALDMIDPVLRPLLFKKGDPVAVVKKPPAQGELAGVPPKPPKLELTDAGVALRTLNWKYEARGCKFVLYEGSVKLTLKDCEVKSSLKLTALEADTVEIEFDVHCDDIDADTLGELGVRKQHDVEGELTMPEPPADLASEGKGIQEDTPLGALKRGAGARAPGGASAAAMQ